ncbi:MAG: tetratricopeptide repeat protein, partial [Alphaproteobacteria bacterium]|nr:tetratricopeptide repeat protein [Alphaproteobacteria bacterium]
MSEPETPDSGAIAAAIEEGLAHHRAGRREAAEALYRRVLEIEPEQPDALHLLGVIAHQRGMHGEAIENIQRAIAASATTARYHNSLGEAYRASGEAEQAMAAYRRALDLDPGHAQSHYNLGIALMSQTRLEEAIASFRRTLEIDPGDAKTHINLGNAFKKSARLDDAVACYREAVRLRPGDAGGHYNLGIALKLQGHLEEAVRCYRAALAIEPGSAKAHNNLAVALREQGRFEEAIANYRGALEITPGYAEAHDNLGNLLNELGRSRDALASYRRALDLDPSNARANYHYSVHRGFAGNEPAVNRLRDLLNADGVGEEDRNFLLYALGNAYDGLFRYDEAFSYYARANEQRRRQQSYDRAAHERLFGAIIAANRGLNEAAGRAPRQPDFVPIFVVGLPRSGKTLVEIMLGQHASVFGASECDLWQRTAHDQAGGAAIADPYICDEDALGGAFIANLGAAYETEMRRIGGAGRYFITTRPDNIIALGLIARALPAARIVECTRDPLDHALCLYFKRFDIRNEYASSLSDIAHYMGVVERLMAHWRSILGARMLSVRYEEIVSGAAAELISAHCG